VHVSRVGLLGLPGHLDIRKCTVTAAAAKHYCIPALQSQILTPYLYSTQSSTKETYLKFSLMGDLRSRNNSKAWSLQPCSPTF
jgi:hypothetical protein